MILPAHFSESSFQVHNYKQLFTCHILQDMSSFCAADGYSLDGPNVRFQPPLAVHIPNFQVSSSPASSFWKEQTGTNFITHHPLILATLLCYDFYRKNLTQILHKYLCTETTSSQAEQRHLPFTFLFIFSYLDICLLYILQNLLSHH